MEHDDNMAELMDELMQKSGCPYLSDLHNPQYAASICEALDHIEAQRYSARAWSNVIQYITSSTVTVPSIGEALEFLHKWLSADNAAAPGADAPEFAAPDADA